MPSSPWARLRACLLLLFVVPAPLVVGAALPSPAGPQPAAAPSRIVAIGDVHGDYDALRAILRQAALVDDAGRWSGGDAVFVQTGDILDRGENVREVMDLLMALGPQAQAAGGRVEVLLGNHEAMNVIGMLRDVNPGVYASFADDQSEQRRNAAYDAEVALGRARSQEISRAGDRQLVVPGVYLPPDRTTWMATHPPGMLEYMEALGPKGTYGRWLRARPVAVRVGDTVFVHGGFSPEFAPKSIEAANDQIRREFDRWDDVRNLLVSRKAALPSFDFDETLQAARAALQLAVANTSTGDALTIAPGMRQLEELSRIGTWYLINPNGPLWFRGFAMWTSEEGRARIEGLAARYKAARFVVGHTPLSGSQITPRFNNRVYLIDTGMLASHYKGGRASALEIRGDRVSAIYADVRADITGGPRQNAPVP
jgi:hypothetical protein